MTETTGSPRIHSIVVLLLFLLLHGCSGSFSWATSNRKQYDSISSSSSIIRRNNGSQRLNSLVQEQHKQQQQLQSVINDNEFRVRGITYQKQYIRNVEVSGTDVADSSASSVDDDGTAPARIIIDPITLFVEPVTTELSIRDVDTILSALEDTIYDYLDTEKKDVLPADLTFVRLGNVLYNGTASLSTNTTTAAATAALYIEKGVVSFTGPASFGRNTEEIYTINTWIREALSKFNLVKYLKDLITTSPNKVSEALQGIKKVSYGFTISTPAPAPLPPAQPNGISESESAKASSTSGKMGTIVSVSVIAAVAVTVLALFMVRKQRNDHTELQETESGLEAAASGDSSDESNPQNNQKKGSTVPMMKNYRIPPLGARKKNGTSVNSEDNSTLTSAVPGKKDWIGDGTNSSVGGGGADNRSNVSSDGQWTMPTEEGDTSILKPIRDLGHAALSPRLAAVLAPSSSNNAVPKTQSNASSADGSLQVLGMATAESFELDRHVNVRKDMLMSAWSSNSRAHHVSNKLSSAVLSPPYASNQSITVLQPSYFSASQESRARHVASTLQAKDEFQHIADIEAIMNGSSTTTAPHSNTTTGGKLLGVSSSSSGDDDDYDNDGSEIHTDESTNAYYYDDVPTNSETPNGTTTTSGASSTITTKDKHLLRPKPNDPYSSDSDGGNPPVVVLNHPKHGLI